MELRRPILFLEVEGVLNQRDGATTSSQYFRPECMACLQKIVTATHCRLVLISDCRTSTEQVSQLNAALAEYSIDAIESWTRRHAPPDLSLPESDRHSLGMIRAREISEWRQVGNRREMAFAVLDPLQMSPGQPLNKGHPACYELEGHLTTTCTVHGLTEVHADAVIAMLSESGAGEVTSTADATKLVCAVCKAAGPSLGGATATQCSCGSSAGRMPSVDSRAGQTLPQEATESAVKPCSHLFVVQLSVLATAAESARATMRLVRRPIPRQASHPALGRPAGASPVVPSTRAPTTPTASVPPPALLARAAPQRPVVSAHTSWCRGVHVASEREPRVVLYPHFLSAAEVAHLTELARWGRAEDDAAASVMVGATRAVSWDGGRQVRAEASGRTVSIHLPSPADDPVIAAIEERCAVATGVPAHAEEEPLGLRHTSPSSADECNERYCTALHVDTNQGGHYRVATVLLYLHEIEGGVGGETRFPLVGAAQSSPLRDAAERLASLGVTAFSDDEAVEFPPLPPRRVLCNAAETDNVGLHIRPRSGLAAVFWTHTNEGLDPFSWHVGARLPPMATEGKLIAQKFKSLPVQYRPARRNDVVKLPSHMAPPRPQSFS